MPLYLRLLLKCHYLHPQLERNFISLAFKVYFIEHRLKVFFVLEKQKQTNNITTQITTSFDIPATTRARQPSRRLVSLETLQPGRTVIGPQSKVVRYVKSGMVVSKKRKGARGNASAAGDGDAGLGGIEADVEAFSTAAVLVKKEPLESSSLHELAELSMQHAKNQFKCEMCSEVFSDRTQLLLHVPIHI